MPDALVSTDWLAERLDAPDVKPVDATWFLPTLGRDARVEYEAAHIPGAVFFDIDDIADEASPLPQQLRLSAGVLEIGHVEASGEKLVLCPLGNWRRQ